MTWMTWSRRLALLLLLAILAGCGGGGTGAVPGGGSSAGGAGAAADLPPAPPPLAGLSSDEVEDAAPAIPEGAEYAPGVVLVKFRGGAKHAADTVQSLQARSGLGLSVQRSFPSVGVTQLAVTSSHSVEDAVKKLNAMPGVEYAEPDYVYRATEVVPSDTRFGELWALKNTGQSGGTAGADIEATFAWDTTMGSPNIIVGIIDTGVDYNHPDLAANMWRNPGETAGNGVDDDGNGYVDDVFGIDTVSNDGDPFDDNEHGTHVAGTIAAGMNGQGVVGVAPNVKIMALKFLDAGGSGDSSDAIACLDYAIAKGAALTSNSWGGGGFSQALQDAIARARDDNQIFVAAAGNDGTDNDTTPHYPSNYDLDNVIAVGAMTASEQRSSFSNFGIDSVDLFAPGSSILSTIPANGYDIFNGTSMATPHVAGVAALVWSLDASQSYLAVKQRIMAGVEPLAAYSGLCVSGGRLNARIAVTQPAPPIFLSSVSPAAVLPGETVELRGFGFGGTTGGVSFPGGAATVTQWGSTLIRATVPGNVTAGNVTVTNASGQTSNGVAITVDPNIVYQEQAATFAWRDISTTGTALAMGDDTAADVNFGFNFDFFGTTRTSVKVSSNGYLTFGTSGTAYANTNLPNAAQPNDLIAPFWDDLNPGSGGQVRWQVLGSAPDRELVVSWLGVPHYQQVGDSSLQVVLREATDDILFQYQDVVFGDPAFDSGVSATIGVENASGARATAHSGNVANGTALRYFVQGPPPGSTIALADGWNLISFPLKDLSSLNLSSGVETTFYWYDPLARQYQLLSAQPAVLSDLSQGGLARAFWVKSVGAGTIQFTGNENNGSLLALSLRSGWNLVGAPSLTPISVGGMRANGELVTGVVSSQVPPPNGVKLYRFAFPYAGGSYTQVDLGSAGSQFQPMRGHWVWAWADNQLSFFPGSVP